MNVLEKEFLKRAIQYKNKYEACNWWQFQKKYKTYKQWRAYLELMIKHGE